MYILLLSLVFLFVVAAIAGVVRQRTLHRKLERGEISEMPQVKKARPDGCCGQHAVCEKERILLSVGEEAEYFEDEELDAFRNRAADSYTSEEEEQFEEVLTTLRTNEVGDWLHSLQLRGIALPERLRDEAILLLTDETATATT